MRYTDSIIHSYEKRLCVKLDQIWNNTYRSIKDKVLVLHTLPRDLDFCVLENIVAKQIGDQRDLFSLQCGEYRRSLEMLDEAFGVQPLFRTWGGDISSKYADIVADTMEKIQKRDKRIYSELVYRGISYGDALYSYLLRNRHLSFDGISVNDTEQCCNSIVLALESIDIAYDLFMNYDYKYICVGEWGYIYGLICRVAQEFGVILYCINILRPNIVVRIEPNRKLFEDVKMEDMTKTIGNNYSFDSLDGEDDLFVLKRDSFNGALEIVDNGKPNIFILAHALIDNARTGDHYGVFFDNYEWLIYTLREIKDIGKYNWYLKDHPESKWYQQEHIMHHLYETYGGDNLVWCDKEFSGEQIFRYADCIVTCAGDAGMEFWARGIPTISAANAFYVDWGISYNAKTREEYKLLLEGAGELEKPSDESTKRAREKILSSRLGYDATIKDACLVFHDIRVKILERYRTAERMHNDIYYEFSERLSQFDGISDYDRIGTNQIVIK